MCVELSWKVLPRTTPSGERDSDRTILSFETDLNNSSTSPHTLLTLTCFHRYDSCNVGTFPNQTLKGDSRSATALHSDASKEKYSFQLSVLSGQHLSYVPSLPTPTQQTRANFSCSACAYPGQDHPAQPTMSAAAP
jgi:hypothetical protein